MNYIEIDIKITPYSSEVSEILTAILGSIGFESFTEKSNGLNAYIQESLFDKNELDSTLSFLSLDSEIHYDQKLIEDENWNEVWEKNYFKPIIIEDKIIIRSTFHEPEENIKHEIIINPKMSFGTGNHSTTKLMMLNILDLDTKDKNILDMGCGTGILGFLASKTGAKSIFAIDIDQWAVNNALENAEINNINNVEIIKGDATSIINNYDIILANINRNILINDMANYANALNNRGTLLVSGFYFEDLPKIKKSAQDNGLTFLNYLEEDDWVAARFVKR